MSSLAMRACKPANEIEAMLAAQFIALHQASMECSRRAMIPEQSFDMATRLRRDAANAARASADMLEALERRRGRGPQRIVVERVMVATGAQAVLRNFHADASLPSSSSASQMIGRSEVPARALDAVPAKAGEGEGDKTG